MTPDEKHAAVKDHIDEFQKNKEAKTLGKQTVAINQFHDTRASLDSVFETVSDAKFRPCAIMI